MDPYSFGYQPQQQNPYIQMAQRYIAPPVQMYAPQEQQLQTGGMNPDDWRKYAGKIPSDREAQGFSAAQPGDPQGMHAQQVNQGLQGNQATGGPPQQNTAQGKPTWLQQLGSMLGFYGGNTAAPSMGGVAGDGYGGGTGYGGGKGERSRSMDGGGLLSGGQSYLDTGY